jgi:hypothetical protein
VCAKHSYHHWCAQILKCAQILHMGLLISPSTQSLMHTSHRTCVLVAPLRSLQMNSWRCIADMADSRAYGSCASLGDTVFAVGGLQSDMQASTPAGWRVWGCGLLRTCAVLQGAKFGGKSRQIRGYPLHFAACTHCAWHACCACCAPPADACHTGGVLQPDQRLLGARGTALQCEPAAQLPCSLRPGVITASLLGGAASYRQLWL